ncbi:ATP-binding protein [Corynebacterium guangdongense]|uniref:Serine/threonine-protein kinase RsbW n=1 Tax=Corynebacterium guangdongense TaxID=1783348 RepID=A0ABU1ZXJ7_9CORY|nr:ATP-binding protein [Corynebacterium guangdongense]MDR7329659.1 serine/threonine-protein kinase RsbW [Corynebacterium guangdongense]
MTTDKDQSNDQDGEKILEGPARLSFVDQVLDAVQQLGESSALGLNLDRTMFTLAVSEIITNIVEHSTGEVSMSVRLTSGPGELRAIIQDSATPALIDWDHIELPDVDAESGRGLALAHAVLDGLHHDSHPDGNTWTLWRKVQDA